MRTSLEQQQTQQQKEVDDNFFSLDTLARIAVYAKSSLIIK